ncbi:MAG: hotdog fold thioesterase [Bacteroidetes bacterium]|jgi:acyl-CoA thioesterase|nr:hotdog fold thioesterase [Bacteroidota bacterium]
MSQSKVHPIVSLMMERDAMSQWLGLEVIESSPGHCVCGMTVRKEMVNGFGIAHGAITYALADSTLAFAVNAMGRHTVSVTSTIQHLRPAHAGDMLTATSRLRSDGGTMVHVDVEVTNQQDQPVALLTATGYKRSESWV